MATNTIVPHTIATFIAMKINDMKETTNIKILAIESAAKSAGAAVLSGDTLLSEQFLKGDQEV